MQVSHDGQIGRDGFRVSFRVVVESGLGAGSRSNLGLGLELSKVGAGVEPCPYPVT